MMTTRDFYQVISSIVPLYMFMFIGYGSVKWWKLFNQEQCLGISRFCLFFAVPMLSFHYITKTNLYEMNLKLFIADVLQKGIVLVVLAFWYKLGLGGSIEWLITIFSICTLPNALILGVPIIKSLYHATAAPLVVEIFLTQSVIWHPLLLTMHEYRTTRIIISQEFGETGGHNPDIETTNTGEQGVAGGISSTDTTAKEVEATSIAGVSGGEAEDLEIYVQQKGHESSRDQPPGEIEQGEIEEVPSISTTKVIPETEYQRVSNRLTAMPSTSLMITHVLIMAWRKLISNPNTYATLTGLVWALVLSKFYIVMPQMMSNLTTFLSNASLGMGMFNTGLSMGLQPRLIRCGKVVAALTMVLRFIIGPIVMGFASLVVGMRGTLFHIAVVQAAISQGVVPSAFAAQYNVYPEIFSIGMILGMIVVLPVTLLYYNLLEIQGRTN